MLSSVFLAIAALGVVQCAPASSSIRNIHILPIVECPKDSLFPQVILTPSVAGQELTASQYVVCVGGEPIIFNCSEGLFFNWSTMSCDFPYERRSGSPPQQPSNETFIPGNLDLIQPAGPIQVPISPQWPVPIWSRQLQGYPYPVPPYPITKPDPSQILPVPVGGLPYPLPYPPPHTKPFPTIPYYYYDN